MYFQVFYDILFIRKRLWTVITLIWLFPRICSYTCIFKTLLSKNDFGHLPHGKFFSTVCLYVCISSCMCWKWFRTVVTWKWFLPVCILICTVKPSFFTKDLKHCRQESNFPMFGFNMFFKCTICKGVFIIGA